MSYCTVDDVLMMAADPDMNPVRVSMLIRTAAGVIDRYCRRTFTLSTGAKTVDFDSSDEIKLPAEMVELDSITTNAGQTFTISDCVLEPASGPPYNKIVMKSEVGKLLTYSGTDRAAITISGTWGYKPEVPAEIKYAAIALVIDGYNRSDLRGLDGVSGPGIRANVSKLDGTLPPDLLPYLNPYKRIRVEALRNG